MCLLFFKLLDTRGTPSTLYMLIICNQLRGPGGGGGGGGGGLHRNSLEIDFIVVSDRGE